MRAVVCRLNACCRVFLHRQRALPSVLMRACAWRSLHSLLRCREDKHRGVHVDLADPAHHDICSPTRFSETLKDAMRSWREAGCSAVWLYLSLHQGALLPIAAENGFLLHHAEGVSCVLCQWLRTDIEDKLPRFATHQVGVAGCVLREDTHEVLVVKDHPDTLWKFPGGVSELGEDIGDTAKREVLEETGVKTEFRGLLALRQLHNQPGAYGRSDLFFVCHLTPATPAGMTITRGEDEIVECQWMSLAALAALTPDAALTNHVVRLAEVGLRDGFDGVHLVATACLSRYRQRGFSLYSSGGGGGTRGRADVTGQRTDVTA